MDTNEIRAQHILARYGFDFKPEYRYELRKLLSAELNDYQKGSGEYLRVLCGLLFCIGNPADVEIIKQVKYTLNMDVGAMIDIDWIIVLDGTADEHTLSREELIEEFIRYYKSYYIS